MNSCFDSVTLKPAVIICFDTSAVGKLIVVKTASWPIDMILVSGLALSLETNFFFPVHEYRIEQTLLTH